MVRLLVDNLTHDFRGVARLDGKACFIPGALPGETVEAVLCAEHDRRAEARLSAIVVRAPERVEPRCAYYGQCGGCDAQHVSPAAQRQFKQAVLLDQLSRLGRVTPRQVLPVIHGEPWHYRRRTRLACHWVAARRQVQFGFRERDSQAIVPVAACPVLQPAMSDVLAPLRECLAGWSQPRMLGHVELLADTQGVIVGLRLLSGMADSDRQRVQAFAQATGARVYQLGDRDTALVPVWPAAAGPVDPLEMDGLPGEFLQANAVMNDQLVAAVIAALNPAPADTVLEAFCGTGNFTFSLAPRVQAVVAAEVSASMLARARERAVALGYASVRWCQADLLTRDVTVWQQLQQQAAGARKLLLDPPREGAHALCEQFDLRGIERLVYVSCNPAALARDAAVLVQRGLLLDSVQLVDMFPQTHHSEVIAVFVPGGKPAARPRPGGKPPLRRLRR